MTRPRLVRFVCVLLLLGAPPTPAAEGGGHPAVSLRPFLEQHCFACHGEKKRKGDLRLDTPPGDLSGSDELERWHRVAEALRGGEMPPPKEPQPPEAERQAALATLDLALTAALSRLKDGRPQTQMRRLNRREYTNTLRDLLGLNPAIFNPARDFPPDELQHGFDNSGEALVTSGFLLSHYLRAADLAVEKAARLESQPVPKKITLSPPFEKLSVQWAKVERTLGLGFQQMWQGPKSGVTGSYLPLDEFSAGAPVDGFYRVRVKACGLDRAHPYDKALVGTDPGQPIRLALVGGALAQGALGRAQVENPTLAVFDLPDDEPAWLEARVWLDQGYQPRLAFPNGPYNMKYLARMLHHRHPDLLGEMPKVAQDRWKTMVKSIRTPRARIYAVEIEGPFYDAWPTASQLALFDGPRFEPSRLSALIERFASRAFRRPATAEETRRFTELAETRQKAGDSPLDAYKAAIKAILCSPAFLYLEESGDPLGPHALAARLSYFLWSTLPDEALVAAAGRGDLAKPGALRAQAERLLEDPRSGAFTRDFPERWLGLHALGAMPPDSLRFGRYYTDDLEQAMRRETQMFFSDLLRHNRRPGLLLHAEYSFLNDALARHYGIPGVQGSEFRRVHLPDPRRGGLLGMASVLTATTNGVDSSPVVRGVWVLENLLGTPPRPPPADVPAIEPDIRGATTIREQLAKHREDPNCASCHRQIDPPGFALESFDAIGGWRTAYPGEGKRAVDPSGEMPEGGPFADIVGFKRILSGREPHFIRCLAEKLLTYALGRPIGWRDRPVVERLLQDFAKTPGGLRDLVLLVADSESFRRK